MALKPRQQQQEQSFTPDEYQKLRDGMKQFKLKRINGRLHGAFDQYLASIDVISFSEDFGDIQVINPHSYKKYNDMRARIEAMDRSLELSYGNN